MTDKRVIYQTNDGGIAVIVPASECGLSAEEIARKDVPAGVPYLIVDLDVIPTDRTFRAAWDADFTQPDGTGIGADAWFEERAIIEAEAEAERQRLAAIEAARLEAERLEAEAARLQAEAERLMIEQAAAAPLQFDGIEGTAE